MNRLVVNQFDLYDKSEIARIEAHTRVKLTTTHVVTLLRRLKDANTLKHVALAFQGISCGSPPQSSTQAG